MANTGGKRANVMIKPDNQNPEVFHLDIIRPDVKISQFSFNKDVYEAIFAKNTMLAQKFKNCLGMLKVPNSTKMLVRCGGHYHLLILTSTSIYSSNVYKKATRKTFERKVASCNRNSQAPGKLDVFLHMLYLLSGSKQLYGVEGESRVEMVKIIREIMKLNPNEETEGVDSDGYSDITVLLQDRNDELCDLSIPPGLQPFEVSLPEDNEKDLLLCKLDLGMIRDAMAEGL